MKFKAWDGKQWRTDIFIDGYGDVYTGGYQWNEDKYVVEKVDWKLIRSTGVYDENNDELYQGHITKKDDTVYEIVLMDNGITWGAKVHKSNSVICRKQTFHLWQYTKHYYNPQEIGKIIGNVFENPELIGVTP